MNNKTLKDTIIVNAITRDSAIKKARKKLREKYSYKVKREIFSVKKQQGQKNRYVIWYKIQPHCTPFNPKKQEKNQHLKGFSVYRTQIINNVNQKPLYVKSNDIQNVVKEIEKKNFGNKKEGLIIIPGNPSQTKTKNYYFVHLTLKDVKWKGLRNYAKEIGAKGYDRETGKLF